MKGLLTLATVLALAACSGGAGRALPTTTSGGGKTLATGKVTLTVKTPSASTQTSQRAMAAASKHKPYYISPNAVSLKYQVYDPSGSAYGAPGTMSLQNCPTLGCSTTIDAPLGSDSMTIDAYDVNNNLVGVIPIGAAPFPTPVVTGATNVESFTLGGVVASVTVRQVHAFVDGVASTSQLVFSMYDADGTQIISIDPVVNPLAATYSGNDMTLTENGQSVGTSATAINPSTIITVSFDGNHISGGSSSSGKFAPNSPLNIYTSDGSKIGSFGIASVPQPITLTGVPVSGSINIAPTDAPVTFTAQQVGILGQVTEFDTCGSASPSPATVAVSYDSATNVSSFTVTPNASNTTAPGCIIELYQDFASVNGVFTAPIVLVTGIPASSTSIFSNAVLVAPDAVTFATVTAPSQTVTATQQVQPPYSGPAGVSETACVLPSLMMSLSETTVPTNVTTGDTNENDDAGPGTIVSWSGVQTVTNNSPVSFTFSPIAVGICEMHAGAPGNQQAFPVSVLW